MKITSICNQAEENLKLRHLEQPKYVLKKKFNNLTFKLKDPITGELLKEYSMTEEELLKLSYSQRTKFKTMEKIENFDEEGYIKEVKKQEEIGKIYTKEYDKEYKILIKTKDISEKDEKLFSDLMYTIYDYFDFEDFSDSEKTKLEFEDEILSNIV